MAGWLIVDRGHFKDQKRIYNLMKSFENGGQILCRFSVDWIFPGPYSGGCREACWEEGPGNLGLTKKVHI